jgi:hypothetical protein
VILHRSNNETLAGCYNRPRRQHYLHTRHPLVYNNQDGGNR